MSEPNFTPGEWKEETTEAGEIYVRIPRHSLFIADLEGSCVQCHANAHLIAAAPDLYAVLDELKTLLSLESDYTIARADGQSFELAEGMRIVGILERGAAALAKARGER
jgi:hypothetical protein